VEIHPLVADATVRLLAVPAGKLAEALGHDLLGLVDTAGDILTHVQDLADAMRQARHFARLESQTGVYLGLRLGQYHSARGLYALARNAKEQAFTLARRVLGERHPHTLASMNDLALTLLVQGDLARAQTLFEQALAARREVLGERHPDTLTSMNDLAAALHAQGDVAGARALLEQVLAVFRELLGERHPDTLHSMNNLAETLYAQGDVARAQTLHTQVLAARRKLLGERHPDTLTSMNNLAEALQALGDLAGARALHEQGLAASREVLGERHPADRLGPHRPRRRSQPGRLNGCRSSPLSAFAGLFSSWDRPHGHRPAPG
jgi:tetratricopeptide (TPR) repeat protein